MNRFHELDALRAFAMLLGVVLHAFLFLLPLELYWPVTDQWVATVAVERNPYAYLLGLIHGFRMPLFFLLSGFFTALLWQSRGLVLLGRNRLQRIALPLVIGCFTIVPIIEFSFAYANPNESFHPLSWLIAWWYSLAHLWFLYLLLWLAAGFILLARLGVKFRHPVIWWLAIPLVVVPQFLMVEPIFGPDTSDTPIPDPVVLWYYALFFLFGAFFYQRKFAMRRWWALALLPAMLLAYPAGLLLLYSSPELAGPVKLATSLMQVAYAWLMCFGTMGLFHWTAARERDWVRYMSDASYWIYLWHLPLVIGAQFLLAGWPVSVHLKLLMICAGVTGILVVVYQLGVRYTPLGTMLNGRRWRHRPAPARATQ